jgi:hypothetical protein
MKTQIKISDIFRSKKNIFIDLYSKLTHVVNVLPFQQAVFGLEIKVLVSRWIQVNLIFDLIILKF